MSFPTSRPVALVLEDDPVLSSIAFEILQGLGYVVYLASDVAEVTVLLERSAVAVLLTDVFMPGNVNGLHFARSVAEQRPETRIIIVSGRPGFSLALLPRDATFLPKPYTEAQIREVLAS